MSAIVFYLTVPFLYLLSILPFPVLYFLSDMLFPIIYYVVAYRKKVVLGNLRSSFPEKSEKEIHAIARKFYRHFTDVIFEILKMRTISTGALRRRMRYSNPELLQDLHDRGKGLIGMLAHYNNWEWTVAISDGPQQAKAIYKPLNNKYFDRFMKKTRERHGVELITTRETLRRILKDQREGRLVGYGFISDQSPVWEEIQYWTEFLNQLTPVFTGAEKMAVRTGLPAIYYAMRKIRRGYYTIDLIPISEEPENTREHEITDKFIRKLEGIIQENPEYWLWTHRRWKLTRRKMSELESGESK
jgi:KDO2-lipid IV(A) lauroyltransferase